MAIRYRAQMAPHADQRTFGWLVALAFTLLGVPFVLAMQRHSPEPTVWGGCLGGAAAMLFAAWRMRGGTLHEITLDDDDGALHFAVTGPTVNVDVRGAITARAYLGEVVARTGAREIAIPTRVLIVAHEGRPVVVLEEALAAGTASTRDWPAARDADLDAPGVPTLMKSVVAPDLEKLRAALISA